MELNFIIRTNRDVDGLTEALIDEISSFFYINNGIVYDATFGTRKQKNGITYKKYDPMGKHDCNALHRQYIPLDGDILEAMLPYKSMAMHIMMRESHYDVYEREYLEDVYYRQLKYWYTEIKENDINGIFYMVMPHHCGEYILYGLARVLSIPMVMLYPQISHGGLMFFLGNAIEGLGNNIKDIYRNTSCNEVPNEYMQKVIGKIENYNTMVSGGDKTTVIKETEIMLNQYTQFRSVMKDYADLLAIVLNIKKRTYKAESIEHYKRVIRLKRKVRYYKKRMDTIECFDRKAIMPQKADRYLYFPLQTTPESSTMPLAGEFKNQLLGIEMVASIASNYELKVYVKEHWGQLYRKPGFYEALSRIKNVRLIHSDVNSLELIRNSLAVVNMTGNCLFEALILGKPAISVGYGAAFKGAPNMFVVNNKSDVINALTTIIKDGYSIKKEEIIKYCVAIQNGAVFSYVDSLEETSEYYNKRKTAKQIVEYFKKYSMNGDV